MKKFRAILTIAAASIVFGCANPSGGNAPATLPKPPGGGKAEPSHTQLELRAANLILQGTTIENRIKTDYSAIISLFGEDVFMPLVKANLAMMTGEKDIDYTKPLPAILLQQLSPGTLVCSATHEILTPDNWEAVTKKMTENGGKIVISKQAMDEAIIKIPDYTLPASTLFTDQHLAEVIAGVEKPARDKFKATQSLVGTPSTFEQVSTVAAAISPFMGIYGTMLNSTVGIAGIFFKGPSESERLLKAMNKQFDEVYRRLDAIEAQLKALDAKLDQISAEFINRDYKTLVELITGRQTSLSNLIKNPDVDPLALTISATTTYTDMLGYFKSLTTMAMEKQTAYFSALSHHKTPAHSQHNEYLKLLNPIKISITGRITVNGIGRFGSASTKVLHTYTDTDTLTFTNPNSLMPTDKAALDLLCAILPFGFQINRFITNSVDGLDQLNSDVAKDYDKGIIKKLRDDLQAKTTQAVNLYYTNIYSTYSLPNQHRDRSTGLPSFFALPNKDVFVSGYSDSTGYYVNMNYTPVEQVKVNGRTFYQNGKMKYIASGKTSSSTLSNTQSIVSQYGIALTDSQMRIPIPTDINLVRQIYPALQAAEITNNSKSIGTFVLTPREERVFEYARDYMRLEYKSQASELLNYAATLAALDIMNSAYIID